MIFISELLTIIAYLLNGRIGMSLSIIIYIYILFKKGSTFFEKLIYVLIFSIPTFNIGFAGRGMHHMFSWCSIFMGVLTIYLIYNYLISKTKLSKNILFITVFTLGIILINCFREVNTKGAIIEWIQICLMFIPLILAYDQRDYLISRISFKNNTDKFLDMINLTILATAVGVIVQYVFYRKLGLRLGNITFYPGRTVYDLLISGASVLSLYLSIGVAINVKKIYTKFRIINLIYILICVVGIVVNSSRTGLVAAIIISILIAMPQMIKNKKSLLITLIMIPVFIFVFQDMVDTLLANRSTSSLFEANGRMGTYKYGFDLLTENMVKFLFGSGLSLDNYSRIIPHNFILETLVTMGTVVSIIIFSLIFIALKYINKNKNKYIIWVILIGSMFITNFQGNTFFTVYMIVMILESRLLIERKVDLKDEESRNFNN